MGIKLFGVMIGCLTIGTLVSAVKDAIQVETKTSVLEKQLEEKIKGLEDRLGTVFSKKFYDLAKWKMGEGRNLTRGIEALGDTSSEDVPSRVAKEASRVEIHSLENKRVFETLHDICNIFKIFSSLLSEQDYVNKIKDRLDSVRFNLDNGVFDEKVFEKASEIKAEADKKEAELEQEFTDRFLKLEDAKTEDEDDRRIRNDFKDGLDQAMKAIKAKMGKRTEGSETGNWKSGKAVLIEFAEKEPKIAKDTTKWYILEAELYKEHRKLEDKFMDFEKDLSDKIINLYEILKTKNYVQKITEKKEVTLIRSRR